MLKLPVSFMPEKGDLMKRFYPFLLVLLVPLLPLLRTAPAPAASERVVVFEAFMRST